MTALAVPSEFPPTVFRAYDIRGEADAELTPQLFEAIGFALFFFLPPSARVVVGHDTRTSSPPLTSALIRGLQLTGLEVIFLGCVTTPMVYWAEHELHCDAGLIVTGSHTPPKKNGLKISIGGRPFFGDQLQDLYHRLHKEHPHNARKSLTSKASNPITPPVFDKIKYARTYLSTLSYPATSCLRIVWDFYSGTTSALKNIINQQLPGNHIFCHAELLPCPDHGFDPTNKHTQSTFQKAMETHQADVGFAFDGDGDRLVVFDQNGKALRGDEVLAFLASHIDTDVVVADIKSSPFLLSSLNKKIVYTRTGHVHLKHEMRDNGYLLGAEVSGHLFFRDRHPGFDDGFYASLRILEILWKNPNALTRAQRNFPKLFSSGELRVPMELSKQQYLMDAILKTLSRNGTILNVDGLKVIGSDFWCLARPSNTESCIVLIWESRTKTTFQKLSDFFAQYLNQDLEKFNL